jgi:hypothetical protein
MTTLSTLKTFLQLVLIFAILSFCYLYADDSRSATVSKESPDATIQAFSHLRYKSPVFKRFLTVSTDDNSVFKEVDKVSGDASTMWMLVVDCDIKSLAYTFEDNKPSTINYDGTYDPNAECKMYQPKFSGKAIPTGEGGGEPQEYSWNVTTDGQNAVYDFDLKFDGKSEEEEETSPSVLIGCNGGRKKLELTAKPKELGGKVKLTLSAGLKLYENATGGNPISIPANGWSPQQLEDKTYYVGGVSGSASMGDQKCEATWEGDNFTTITDKAVATVVEVDVKITNNDYTDEPGALIRKKNDETATEIPRTLVSVVVKPADLDKGSVTLTIPAILKAWKDQTSNENSQLVWNLTKAEDRNADKKVYCSGETANKGELNLSHADSGAADKAKVTVYEIDLVVDNLKENAEENPGTFLGIKTRKVLTIKANPVSLGGQVKITTNGLKLYNGATETTQRQWNVGSVPNLQIGGTASATVRDKTCTLEWADVTGLTENDLVKATVVVGNMTPSSLFTVTNHETDTAYVHWNIDNDDNSTVTLSEPAKHPGGDYKQNHVVGENNLKTLGLGLTPDLNIGTIKLTIGANAKLWKAMVKGPSTTDTSNLVLASGTKSWNLANPTEKAEFNTLKSTLFVEGINGGEPQDFKWEYKPPVGNEFELDKVKYKFIAADCGKQPVNATLKNSVANYLGIGLEGCEWSVLPDIGDNNKFNCIAHSVNKSDRWYDKVKITAVQESIHGMLVWTTKSIETETINSIKYYYIDKKYGDGDGVFRDSITETEQNQGKKNDIDELYKFYGFTPTATSDVDAKIIYYSNFHAVKRKNCDCGTGKWRMFESKGGDGPIIEHRIIAPFGTYGNPVRYYK